jgi:hypothetical protein
VSHKTLSCPVLIPIDSGHEKGIVLRSAGGGMTAFTVSSTAGKDAFDWSADGKWVLASLGMMLEPNLWIQGSGTQRRETSMAASTRSGTVHRRHRTVPLKFVDGCVLEGNPRGKVHRGTPLNAHTGQSAGTGVCNFPPIPCESLA